jgi:endoglucanase
MYKEQFAYLKTSYILRVLILKRLCNNRAMKKTKTTIAFFKLLVRKLSATYFLNQRTLYSCLIVSFIFIHSNVSAQFLHAGAAAGGLPPQILDKDNQPIILRGTGIGGWMIQEPYMLEISNSNMGTASKIKAQIKSLIGDTDTQGFYDAWLTNFCTKRDVDSLAAWGFNSIRLPMHYNLYTLPIEQEPTVGQNTWLDKGFAMTDSLLKWCAANHMYLILDLHAAPGGQGRDAAISDYDASKPSLWESDNNKAKTVALWKKLADRYKDEPYIGAYDLLNEINWNFASADIHGCNETTNAPLRALYVQIIAAIREVDNNHMVIIEGNCWGNNHSGLHSPKLDPNMVISFHKYWNYNDQGSIQGLLTLRTTVGAPLWMGESGENSNVWFTDAIKLAEGDYIGWSWWPLKKAGSVVGPLTVVENPGYKDLLNYWNNNGSKPSAAAAKTTLMQLAENLKLENCVYHKDVIDAMFRQVHDNTSLPFGPNKIPGVIYATDYDLGKYNSAYVDTDTATYHVTTGTYTAWNSGWTYRNDGVDIQSNTDSDPTANKLNVGWTADGEWLKFTLNVDSSAAYNITLRYSAASATSVIRFNINGIDQTNSITLPATSGWGNTTISDVILYKGVQKFKFYIEKGGANFGYLKFDLSKQVSETPFKASAAATATSGSVVYVSLNKKTDSPSVSTAGLSATVNTVDVTITDAHLDVNNPNQLVLTLDHVLTDADVVRISYAGNTITATDATLLENFTNLLAKNNLPYHFPIPGKIEAESFLENHGLQFETCTDSGGGQDAGYTDNGDYMTYRINVSEATDYTVDARVAANSQTGKIEVQQLNDSGVILNSTTIDVPVTGGWQNWQTSSAKISLAQGTGVLKVKVVQNGFNLNWINFTKYVVNGVKDENQGSIKVYPNPTSSHLCVEVPDQQYRKDNVMNIRSTTGSLMKHHEQVSNQTLKRYYVGDLPAGLYILEFSMGGKVYKEKFVIQQ